MKVEKSAIAWIRTGKSLVIQYQGRSLRLKEGSERHTHVAKLIARHEKKSIINDKIIDYLFGKGSVKTVKGQKRSIPVPVKSAPKKDVKKEEAINKIRNMVVTKESVSWVESPKSLIVHVKDCRPIVLQKGTKRYDQVKVIIEKHEKRVSINEKIKNFLFPDKDLLPKYSDNSFSTDKNGTLWVKGCKLPVDKSVSKRLVEFFRQDLPYMPLVNFWKNLEKNPSEKSRSQLFLFLKANHMPITPDGCFLAYKQVDSLNNGHLVDNYTKKISNDIGKIVKMNRKDVDADRHSTCSQGLHVAAWDYAQDYSGDTLIEVKVNPRDVVAVPNDYNNQKMRVCQYQPWSLSKSEIDEQLIAPDALRLKKRLSKSKLKNKLKAVGKGKSITVNSATLTAQDVIDLVREKTKEKINQSLKNKQGILNKAAKVLKKFGFRVVVK